MAETRSPLERVKDFFQGMFSREKPETPAKPSKKNLRTPGEKGSRATSEKTASQADPPKKPRTFKSECRESMEAVVVAFILAFLFRTFEAEAFVIPTGSMAPTLLGRNKETTCPKCGQHIVVGASDEIEQETGWLDPKGMFIRNAVCPNCRSIVSLDGLPVFTGDRILVTKFPFELSDPKRFDVIVFKYPKEPQTNYIKRLVGLPGEEIQIRQGDVYVRKTEGGKWRMLRKDDPNKQRVLQILVYDNDHPEKELHKHDWPKRWAAVQKSEFEDTVPNQRVAGWEEDLAGWSDNPEGNSFTLPAARTEDGQFRWLRYRHLVPSTSDWLEVENAEEQKRTPQFDPWKRVQLITDFCGYNAFNANEAGHGNDQISGHFWVGDLTLNCRVNIEDRNGGELLLELNQGARPYRCRIDLATGEAVIFYPNLKAGDGSLVELGRCQTPIKGSGSYDLSFANVDNRLCLWVDNTLMDFGTNEEGQPNGMYLPFAGENMSTAPVEQDLIPVGIAAKGADVTVSRLKLERDIYYHADWAVSNRDIAKDMNQKEEQYNGDTHGESKSPHGLHNLLGKPAEWYEAYSAHGDNIAVFDRLGPDEFFVMGDNSPRSKDSRLWTNERPGPKWQGGGWAERAHAVPRSALVGKAFYIYWPHGKPFLNGGNGFPVTYHKHHTGHRSKYPSFRFPFYPNFGRMKRIH